MIRKTRGNHKDLYRTARDITDGTPVDWEAEKGAEGNRAHQLRNLQSIEEVARAYRGETGSPGQGAEKPREDTPEPPSEVLRTATITSIDRALHTRVTMVWGQLLVLEKIGEGKFAEVFRAYDPALKLEVALKLLKGTVGPDDPRVARFLDEARRLARVHHPNVVDVHGADLHNGRVGLWTDLVRGETLERVVKERGPLGPREAAGIGIDLCCALSSLHANGLVHRDIKPSNLMRQEGGTIVLMDFGSAVEFEEALQLSDRFNGTPVTTAPEVLLEGEPPQPRADIYSLGATLFWLLSGRYPVEAESIPELLRKHERGDCARLADVRADLPLQFTQVVEQALARDPAQRFHTPGEMQRALCAAFGTIAQPELKRVEPAPEPDGRELGAIERFRRWIERYRRWAVAVAAAAVVVFGGWELKHFRLALPLDAQATLFRIGEAGRERLQPGAHVGVGQKLVLEIKGSRPMHVYVLDADDHGEAFVLWEPDHAKSPLVAGVSHLLPPSVDGAEQYWQVSSAGGSETILVVAARQILPELEQMIATWPRVNEARPGSLGSLADDRGIGAMVPGPRIAGDSLLPNMIEAVMGSPSNSKGIWFWKIHLVNDGG